MAERWSPQQPLSSVMKRGALYKQFEGIRMSKRIAAIIDPLCRQMMLGVPITPDRIQVKVKQVRPRDQDPYALNEDGMLLNQVVEKVTAEVSLPGQAMLAKFKQMLPSLHQYMATRGFGAVTLVPVVDTNNTPPNTFLHTEIFPKIGDPEAAKGAEELAKKLRDDSPLKKQMELLAESMKKGSN